VIPPRVAERVKRHDWASTGTDFVIVVLGIFIALQANLWVQSRQDVETERRYLERLLADSDANVHLLQQAISLNERRAATLASFNSALENKGPVPNHADLSDVMCRWFVQPAVDLQRGTYSELVSSGRLALMRDDSLRSRLAREEGAHEESQRLDILVPAILQAAAPLSEYRRWKIVGIDSGSRTGAGRSGVDCDFDIDGMRRDRRVSSVVAQLYRDQTSHKTFRERELSAVLATQTRLRQLLGRPA
jgi:hypothetical protein